jgi:hypothetical protein
MFKWTITEVVTSKADPKNIWDIWEKVEDWPTWDKELEWAKLENGFELHARGALKPKGMSVYHFKITGFDQGKSFTTHTPLFMANMTFVHELKPMDSGTQITQRITVSGLLAPFLYFVMRKGLQNGLRRSLLELARLAESKGRYG